MSQREKAEPGGSMDGEFQWPPRSTLRFYDRNHLRLRSFRQCRSLDLSDTLMLYCKHKTRVVHFGICSKSTRMQSWDKSAVIKLERLIRHDLKTDGYRVTIRRESTLGNACTEEFLWRLAIRPA